MSQEKRLQRVFRIVLPFVRPLSKWLLNYSFQPLPKVEGPYLLLCNHNTDFDCVLLGISAGKQVYFVATENVLRMGFWGKVAMRYFNPIIHYKGKQGLITTRSILSHIKNKESVAMFPEGNRSFNGLTCSIPPATGKLAKACKATLITYRFNGGYFTTPRWGKGIRKGRLTGTVVGVYSPETLAALTPAEISEKIEKDLFVDAYKDQEKSPVAYKCNALAEKLESTLFLCPSCKKFGSLHSNKHTLSCSCGLLLEMDEFGYLKDKDKKHTITQLDEKQREFLQNLKAPDDEIVFSDKVTLQEIDEKHKIICQKETVLKAYMNKFKVDSFEFPFDEIEGLAINQRNLLLLNPQNTQNQFECKGDEAFSALKYLYLYKTAKNRNKESV